MFVRLLGLRFFPCKMEIKYSSLGCFEDQLGNTEKCLQICWPLDAEVAIQWITGRDIKQFRNIKLEFGKR